jgi:hypothetical protein
VVGECNRWVKSWWIVGEWECRMSEEVKLLTKKRIKNVSDEELELEKTRNGTNSVEKRRE